MNNGCNMGLCFNICYHFEQYTYEQFKPKKKKCYF